MGILNDIIIGLVTGIVSGVLSSIMVNVFRDAQEHRRNFENEKQLYSRYIQHIKLELYLAYKNDDYDGSILTIGEEPLRNFFNKLSKESREELDKIYNNIDNWKSEIVKGNYTMSEKEYRDKSNELSRYVLTILKLKENIF